MRRRVLALSYVLACSSAHAFDCSELAPTRPTDTDVSFTGKVDAKVDGLFKRLFSGGADIEGTYDNISNNVLKDFPNADKLYIWDRVIYLECQVISESRDMSSAEKLAQIQILQDKFSDPPPSSKGGNYPQNNTVTNSGSNSTIIQGIGNTINAK